jgi:hypothetical protein
MWSAVIEAGPTGGGAVVDYTVGEDVADCPPFAGDFEGAPRAGIEGAGVCSSQLSGSQWFVELTGVRGQVQHRSQVGDPCWGGEFAQCHAAVQGLSSGGGDGRHDSGEELHFVRAGVLDGEHGADDFAGVPDDEFCPV